MANQICDTLFARIHLGWHKIMDVSILSGRIQHLLYDVRLKLVSQCRPWMTNWKLFAINQRIAWSALLWLHSIILLWSPKLSNTFSMRCELRELELIHSMSYSLTFHDFISRKGIVQKRNLMAYWPTYASSSFCSRFLFFFFSSHKLEHIFWGVAHLTGYFFFTVEVPSIRVPVFLSSRSQKYILILYLNKNDRL